MKRLSLIALLLLLVTACKSTPNQTAPTTDTPAPAAAADTTRFPLSAVPDDLLPHVGGPVAAIKQVKGALSKRVMSEMKAGGPMRAINVCRDEALAVTAKAAEGTGIELGRTAAKLRNPKNAAPAWLRDYVAETADKKASEVEPMVFDLGDRVGVVQPIGTAGMCSTCHGSAEELDETIKETLATSYPDDKAVGFAAGDLRGLFWAVKKK